MTAAIKERCSDSLARLLVRWAMAAVLGIRGASKHGHPRNFTIINGHTLKMERV